ncbi:MAG TPA: hypothetical protein VN231_04020 [Allosphingosinicella sp.]|nr:hypothetical protein [Allosphingosinicella sp.]
MNRVLIGLGGALAVAGCTVSSEEDQLENAIRENLSSRGNVQEVELTRQDDDNMNGFVVMRAADGSEGRLNCTARRSSGSNFNWRCSPVIDEQVLTQIENLIRQSFSSQGTVLAVEMTKQDDDNMTGYAQIRDSAGNEGRVDCTAARDPSGDFAWQCAPPGAQPAE